MKYKLPSDFQKTIQCQFDCKLKRTVKGVIWNYKKELKRRKDKEIPFCELPVLINNKNSQSAHECTNRLFLLCLRYEFLTHV